MSDGKDQFVDGLYEALIDRQLHEFLGTLDPSLRVAKQESLDSGESHDVLARHLAPLIARALHRVQGSDADRVARQISICNEVIELLAASDDRIDLDGASIESPGRRLLRVKPVLLPTSPRPDTPLSTGCILTGPPLDPSFVSQLQAEITNADRIDILCSFIKWSGIRILEPALRSFGEGPEGAMRVITTAYMGATDLKAVDFLTRLPNTRLRVSYDTKRTRLHAKAYIFHRRSGYGTAYVGSANISNPALTDGLEWVVKISQQGAPHLWAKITATFEGYVNDKRFQDYHGCSQDRDLLRASLEGERGAGQGHSVILPTFDVRPYPYQQEILYTLEAERTAHGRTRNLVVAATGTGKTVIAAFDYLRHCRQRPKSRLLFVAHRKEILEQARATFRGVLRDANFGDLLVGEYEPLEYDHLFASIQSFNSRRLGEKLPADHFDFVVIDEFHHAAADTYTRLFDAIAPEILLGLTATPERADGLDILGHFGGRIASEMRLPDAVNRKLLCPFQYFGVTDHHSVDLSQITWQAGRFVADELDGILTQM